MEEDGKGSDNTVQPKREWILPARAKPGRKPSETEPPTVSKIVVSESRLGESKKLMSIHTLCLTETQSSE